MSAVYGANWQFAPTGGGIIHGYNNAGAEHFKQDPIGKLVRETIQNSLDAHEDGLGAVGVNIQRCDIAQEYIGADSLKIHIQRALERTLLTGQVEGQDDYRKALKIIERPTIPCLSIIDRNTTGLQGRKWDSLIYEEGAPEKDNVGGIAGGSFGIGKNAPYNVAALHTVIYCTRYTDGKRGRVERMTGRAQLVSHQAPDGQDMLQHIGFYTDANGQPLTGPDVPHPFRLEEPGTGLWVVGFMTRETDWRRAAVRATAGNFFHAIHNRKLEVVIGEETIGYDTIDGIMEVYISSRDRRARNYYRAICGEPSGTTVPAGPIGALDVYIDNEANAPKRVAYVNRRGMLITDSRERRRGNPFYPGAQGMWPNYAAVVMAKDDDTDGLVRRMENPSHDIISIDRLSDEERRAIRPHLANANEQIKEIIANEIREHEEAGATNLRELAELFPDLDPTIPGNQDLEARTITPTLPRHHVIAIDAPEEGGEPALDENGIEVPGIGGNDGRPDSGNGRKRNGKARPDPGSGRGNGNAGGQTSIISKARIVRANPTELTLAFNLQQKDKGSCAFTIRPAGDEHRREKRIPINGVRIVSPQGASAELEGSLVRIKGDEGGQTITLALEIGTDAPYLAYTISEHKGSD
jgi:uncharacterized membrane protein